MKTSSSVLQWGHPTRLDRDGCTRTSPSQALHLKCIIGVMRALIVILLVAASVHAQSLADVAGSEKPGEASDKSAEKPKEPPKPQPPAVDPVKEWNAQLDKVRAKIQSLQEEEAATQLRINQLNNQIYAPVVDQAAKDQALAQV